VEKKFLKKIIAQSYEDLQMISACCSQAKVKLSDIKFLKKNKIFLILIERLNREENRPAKKVQSIIKFEYILNSKSKNIDQTRPDIVFELLAIDVLKKENNFEIILLFSKNGIITLTAEILDVTLEDQNINDDKSN